MMKVKTKTKKKMIRQIRKIRLLIRLIDWLSLPQYGPLSGMDPVQFDNLLSRKALASCSLDELKIAYEELLHSQPPPRISADFLKGNIAWALQALEQNKTPSALRQALTTQMTGAATRNNHSIKSGTRLIREWQGQTYEVAILDEGYLWQGEQYRSLSRIAKEITGTQWSGPRFFGLTGTSNG